MEEGRDLECLLLRTVSSVYDDVYDDDVYVDDVWVFCSIYVFSSQVFQNHRYREVVVVSTVRSTHALLQTLRIDRILCLDPLDVVVCMV